MTALPLPPSLLTPAAAPLRDRLLQTLHAGAPLLIDGGAGQVGAAAGILADLGIDDLPLVGVAKGIDRDAGKEEFHRPGERPFALRHNDPVLYFVQRLRDEAHRFAITYHRSKRGRAMQASALDGIPRRHPLELTVDEVYAGKGAARRIQQPDWPTHARPDLDNLLIPDVAARRVRKLYVRAGKQTYKF